MPVVQEIWILNNLKEITKIVASAYNFGETLITNMKTKSMEKSEYNTQKMKNIEISLEK